MVDEVASRDVNRVTTLLGVTESGDIRRVTVANDGRILVDLKTTLSLTGVSGDELKVQDANSHLLKEVLVELKINNEYLHIMIGDRISETDIEIK